MPVFDAGQDLALGRAVAAQLVRHNYTWHVLQVAQQLAGEPLGSPGTAPALHEDVEHVAMLIDCTPEVMQLARMRINTSLRCHLSPGQGRRRFSALANRRLKRWLANGLVTDHDAESGQNQLNVAQANLTTPDREHAALIAPFHNVRPTS